MMKLKDGFKSAIITTQEGTIGEATWNFNLWEKGDIKRVYVNYRGKRKYGYIDLADGSNHVDKNGFAQEAVEKFIKEYVIA